MQLSFFGEENKPRRTPTLVVKRLDAERVGIRFWQIGSPQRFRMLLQRFRFDFPLAACEQWDGQPWWMLAATQGDEVLAFCRRNGLHLVEEE